MGLRSLMWRLLGRPHTSRLHVGASQLNIPAISVRTSRVHIPPLEALTVPTVLSLPLTLATLVSEVACDLDIPEVHGRAFGREEDETKGTEEATPPSVGGETAKPSYHRDATGTPYLSAAMYALLLPPAEDLTGITFEWPSPLYPFQIEGIHFLLASHQHALLADDMGLGKTIQAIAAVRILLRAGWIRKVLVLCPASLKTNWQREFSRWAPEVRCEVIEGDREDRRWCWSCPCHVLIGNYRSLIRDHDYGFCDQRRFDLVIIDEAQRIKNRGTKTAQTTKALNRSNSWGLTGTPVENATDDIVSIFEFVNPELRLSDASTNAIRERIAPYFLRRRKADVLTELPPKRIADRWLSLTSAQRREYNQAETQGVTYLRELGREITIPHVFALITRLKQICNLDPRSGDSCKLDYLRDILSDIAQEGEKALVFSQYVNTLRFLEKELRAFAPIVYDGSMNQNSKDQAIRQFWDSESPLMLVSLMAGGLGLNLQVASWVFHYDRWWNPATERQAEDRAHRIGQRAELLVERLMCQDTIEERIYAIQQRKQRLIDEIVEADYTEGRESLSHEEMFEALGLDPGLAGIARRNA